MKICPKCQAKFDENESFCSKDGTKLKTITPLKKGLLAGGTLDKVATLDNLLHVDEMAERYSGTLVGENVPTWVTVFNQKFVPISNAKKRMETARALVGTPLPVEVNIALRANLDHTPPYIIHSQPAGPSVRELLEQDGSLPWELAVKVIASTARVLEWLHEHGILFRAIHSGAIYISDLREGKVQVAEWAYDSLMDIDSPLETLKQDESAFVGYVDYLAPELATSFSDGDVRSTVYALGILLYEMVTGFRPLKAPTPEETLNRHRLEKPIPIQIATPSVKVHPDLSNIIDMMLAKKKDQRFQTPGTIIAVLSNLLETTPLELAPKLERNSDSREDELFQTIDMESFDRSSIPELAPLVEKVEEAKNSLKAKSTPRKTLMMGSIDIETANFDARPSIEIEPGYGKSKSIEVNFDIEPEPAKKAVQKPKTSVQNESESTPKKTVKLSAEEIAELGKGDKFLKEKRAETPPKKAAKKSRKEKRKEKKSLKTEGSSKKTMLFVKSQTTEKEKSVEKEEKSVEIEKEKPVEKEEEKIVKPSSGPGPVKVSDPDQTIEDNIHRDLVLAAAKKAKEESEKARRGKQPTIEVGKKIETSEADGEWFSTPKDETWERSFEQDGLEDSKTQHRTIFILAFLGALLLGVGTFVYVEYLYEPAKVPGAESATTDEPKKEKADAKVDELYARFEKALASGKLVAPMGEAASSHLEKLELAFPTSSEFKKAKAAFSTAVLVKSDTVATDLAINLVREAKKIDPSNSALSERFDALNATLAGTLKKEESENQVTDDQNNVEKKDDKTSVDKEKIGAKEDLEKTEDNANSKEEAKKLIKKAKSAYGRGQGDAAKKLYFDALKLHPGSSSATGGLAAIYFDKGDYAKAATYYSKAVKGSGSIKYRISLGQAYYRLGRYKSAIKTWKGVLKKSPNNKSAKSYIELAERKLR